MKKPLLVNRHFWNQWEPFSNKTKFVLCCQEKLDGCMVTDEFLENRIILQKSVATIGSPFQSHTFVHRKSS